MVLNTSANQNHSEHSSVARLLKKKWLQRSPKKISIGESFLQELTVPSKLPDPLDSSRPMSYVPVSQVAFAKCLPPRAIAAKMPVAKSPVAKCQCHPSQLELFNILRFSSLKVSLRLFSSRIFNSWVGVILLDPTYHKPLLLSPFLPPPIDMFGLFGVF